MLKQCAKRACYNTLQKHDLFTPLPFKDNQFDCLLSVAVTTYLSKLMFCCRLVFPKNFRNPYVMDMGVGRENSYTFKIVCHFSCINTTKKCNTVMERKFCVLFGTFFKNCEKFSYEALFLFFWQVAESAYADLKSNFKILFEANMAVNVSLF